MTSDVYWAACTLAADWRRGYLPHGVNLRSDMPRFPLVRKAVYIACDATETIAYVGKVARDVDSLAFASRANEHVADPAKADRWARLYAVPLRHDTPAVVVTYLEAVLIDLLEPYQNKRRPSVKRLAPLAEAYLTAGGGAP